MIYLVDFGLTGSFRKASAKARNIYNGEIGTIRFCSVASHLGLEQFPKDDLESLGYVLIYLVRKDLPWIGLGQFLSDDERCQVVK